MSRRVQKGRPESASLAKRPGRRTYPSGSRLLYQNRRLAAIASRWDARAAGWDRSLQQPHCHLNQDRAYARFLREARRIIGRRGAFCASQGVIDAGCGTGLVLAEVNSKFAWGIGVDLSRGMIRAARRKRIPKAQFLVGDCFALSGICAPAGAILSRGVLLSHYGPKQGFRLLKALAENLVPHGFLLLDFLNRSARGHYPHLPDTKTYFYGQDVCKMAKKAGFRRGKIIGALERRVLILMAEM